MLESMPENFCINEKDITNMTDKEYLKEFSKGPCNPSLVLPGLLSTKLSVIIDCPVLQKDNPRIFRQCGWNACEKKFYEVSNIILFN